MATKIFLCWSGTRSRQFAERVKTWLEKVFDKRVQVSISTQIEKGSEWFEELKQALAKSECGILCLTPESTTSPWIHFEAGLLVQELAQPADGELSERERRVFPFLYGTSSSELKGPLSAYQSTSATDSDDVLRLLETVNQFLASAGIES